MKIGIITHHYVKNYGAYLQAYALINRIKQIDNSAEVEIINKVVHKHYWLNVYRKFKIPKSSEERKKYFDRIRQFKTLTKYEHSIPTSRGFSKEYLEKNYDKIIIGSDEVWNFLDYSYSPIKFGYGLEKLKVYTYAASAGEVSSSSKIPNHVKRGIKNLRMIGVRDNNTKYLANRLTDNECTVVLDPTLIYNYDKELEEVQNKNFGSKYILIYGCKFNNDQKKVICKFAKERKLKIIGAGEYKDWYDEAQINLTPFEWIKLYINAEVVLTGTFHGLMFSLKYDKNFICLPVFQNRINKTRTILEEVNLTNRLIINPDDITGLRKLLDETIDYSKIHPILNKRIEESELYLKEVLKD